MNNLDKPQRLKLLLEMIAKHNITAYEIGINKNLNISALDKILKGITKNPQNSTLDAIEDYLSDKMLVDSIGLVSEPKVNYNSASKNDEADYVINYLINNTSELLKNRKFQIWYENIILKAQNDFLKGSMEK